MNIATSIMKNDDKRFDHMPEDCLADFTDKLVMVGLDFVPELAGYEDPAYIVEELELEHIELFGVNFNNQPAA
jgi:hypothetical protein